MINLDGREGERERERGREKERERVTVIDPVSGWHRRKLTVATGLQAYGTIGRHKKKGKDETRQKKW